MAKRTKGGTKASLAARRAARKAYEAAKKKYKPGEGGRSRALKKYLMAQGYSEERAGAIIGTIGRKKYGAKKMARWAAQGRKRKKKK
ncbi:MAG: hypothetical protein DRJ64_01510 [Thermoprotei archaeon]|nr:MAG: hypothetical protein DRJ64_01510 [Thermoprotei archaeon]